tara:strand:- start:558 stop:695 length:138 start_codon:yes stop_codon:yes gene_type:complete
MQATKKNILPSIAHLSPMLDIIKHIAEITNKIQPVKLILLLFIIY